MDGVIVCKRVASGPQSLERNLANQFDLPIYSINTQQLDDTDIKVRKVPQTKPPLVGNYFSGFFDRLTYSFWKPPSDFDTVITSGLRTQPLVPWPEQRRIHYYHGIHRGAFGYPPQDRFSDNSIVRTLQMVNRAFVRSLNESSFNRIDTLVANSQHTAEMIECHYEREVDKIIPPTFIDIDSYSVDIDEQNDYYLFLGRLASAKGVETIVEAFNELGEDLVVAGEGPLRKTLQRRANENVQFAGYVSESKKRELFAKSKGFVQNTYAEPFGITTIEAFASGTPVIAVDVGNNPYLISEGSTGVLYSRNNGGKSYQRPNSSQPLISAIKRAESISWDHDHIRHAAEKFDRTNVLSQWEQTLNQ